MKSEALGNNANRGPNMSRRRFLEGGAAVTGAALLPTSEALAQEHPIHVLKRVGADMDRHVNVFPKLLVSEVVSGSPEVNLEIKRFESMQQEMLLGAIHHLKRILRLLEQNEQIGPGNPATGVVREIEDHARDMTFKAAEFIEDERKFREMLAYHKVRQTPELVRILNERKRIVGDIAVPITQALPDLASTRNLFKRPYR